MLGGNNKAHQSVSRYSPSTQGNKQQKRMYNERVRVTIIT